MDKSDEILVSFATMFYAQCLASPVNGKLTIRIISLFTNFFRLPKVW